MPETFDHPISWGSEESPTYRVLKAQFGDGYSQMVGDGINNRVRKWSIKFDSIDESEANEITDFFDAQAGHQSFFWTPPKGTKGRWVCLTYTRTPVKVGLATISATFNEVFFP